MPRNPLHVGWGVAHLCKVQESSDFWCLFDELVQDVSGFVHNRETLLDAYRDGRMFSLRVDETHDMYRMGSRDHPLFAREHFYGHGNLSWYMLPCFCIIDPADPACPEIVWVHSRARLRGLARTLVDELNITKAYILDDSLPFWTAVGFAPRPPELDRRLTFVAR